MELRRDWSVCLVEPGKYGAQITVDLLRACGAVRLCTFANGEAAFEGLRQSPANVIFCTLDDPAFDGLAWTRALRRDRALACRSAPIFLLTSKLSRAIAEECRHAGANAIIGKPTSVAALSGTIKKVLANPRPFIDAAGYVGPCRRAGIVTTAAHKRRRNDVRAA
ncbi:MAG: response regulator transcription factor [Hyphomonadaceae bacterium]|nr:response regulator transcription factor [Hyphomonadaceae bacterium]